MKEKVKTRAYGRASTDPEGRILRAARTLFFTDGFDRVSVERLAKSAGVSKSTLYKYYGDMPGVLRAVAESEADQFSFDPDTTARDPQKLKEQLIELGTALLKAIDKAEKLQFDRLVFEQARHHPGLALAYYKALYARTQEHLARHIEIGQDAGVFRRGVDADILADQLLSMWLGLSRTQAILGVKHGRRLDPGTRSREAVLTLCGSTDLTEKETHGTE